MQEKWLSESFVFISFSSSFKKSGSGQGGQSRINPVGLSSEISSANTTSRAAPNGSHGHPPIHGKSNSLFHINLCIEF